MKRLLLMFLICSLWLAPPLWAQGEFPLQSQALDSSLVRVAASGGQDVAMSAAKPAGLKGEPKELGDNVTFGVLDLGGRKFLMAKSADNAKLVIDADGSGDLAKGQLIAAGKDPRLPAFSAMTFDLGGGKSVQVIAIRMGANLLRVIPATAAGGTVKIGDQSVKVAVVDANLNGKFDDLIDVRGIDFGKPVKFDLLAVDINGNGTFEVSDPTTVEATGLPDKMAFAGAWYTVKVAADGSKVTIEKTQPKLGTLDLGSGAGLTLVSANGLINVDGSGGKVQLPEGSYYAAAASLSRKADDGDWFMSARLAAEARTFEIKEGQTAAFKLGDPLIVKPTVKKSADGTYAIGCQITGQGGESYSGATKGLQREPAPSLKIVDENGKQLASGQLAYG